MRALLGVCLAFALAGCSSVPIIETKLVDKPVPVFCKVELPAECPDSYAIDRVSANDSPVVINRALRAEIEQRWACEVKLRAAIKGCNTK